MKKDRNYGIDLLKMLSMFMVVLLHILGYSQLQNSAEQTDKISYLSVCFLAFSACCAVNLFSMVTGYLVSEKKFKYRKIIPLWLQVIFYSIGIMLVFILAGSSVLPKTMLKLIFPISARVYWYATSYFCLFFFIPFLNILIKSLSKKQFTILIITIFVFFSVVPTITAADTFNVFGGYSPLWLSCMYLFGAFIRKYNVAANLKATYAFLMYISVVILSFIFKAVPGIIQNNIITSKLSAFGDILYQYTSPTVILSAFALFVFFRDLRIKENGFISKIAGLSKFSLGVYLIHMHPGVYSLILAKYCPHLQKLPGTLVFAAILGISAVIFFIGIFLDWLRDLLFRALKISKATDKIAEFAVDKFRRTKFSKKLESTQETNE